MTQEVNTPLVTVLMAVYNGEKYLKESIASILEQTFTDFEFLIINDGSTDKSVEVINSFKDSRIKFVNNQGNIGVIRALNRAIDLIQGEYIARMDCDDICSPDRLEKEVAILKSNPDIAVVAANVSLIDTEGKGIGFWPEDINTKTNEEICRMLPYENCIANPTVMLRSDYLKKHKYNAFQKSSEDWDLWLRMASDKQKFYKINEALVKYRIHSSSITAGFNRKSVFRKKNSIQVRYFFSRMAERKLTRFDFRVLKNGVINYFKYVINGFHPSILPIWTRLRSASPMKAITQFYHLFLFCNKENIAPVYFFFPYFHVGGAEKVHLDIMEAVADQKPVCFITGVSSDNGFYADFKKSATLIDISVVSNYPGLGRLSKKMIARFISNRKDASTLGCNSKFYYELLPYFKAQVKCIDLIHAFVHKGEDGAEYWSLPVTERLDKRVVINKKTIEDYKTLYRENKKKDSLLSRIIYIPNCTNVPAVINKTYDKNLKILFVGRNGREKRVYLIGKIAARTIEANSKTTFQLIGAGENAIAADERKYCTFRGVISGENEMQEIYSDADILLLTSTREGFPMVIMEAMANGLVVITTDVGGIRDYITDKENGILIISGEENQIVNDFALAISELDSDREKLKNISQAAYSYAKENFSKQNFKNSYRKLLLPTK